MTTILVAEDNADVREMLTMRLRHHGFAVVAAENGLKALELARAAPPDIFLMDLNMPQLDGWEASCQIRRDSKLCKTPIIALTAYVLPGDQARALQAGCDAYHPKPIDMQRLLAEIEDQMRRYQKQP